MGRASASANAQKTTNNSQTSVDAKTGQRMDAMWAAGQASGNAGPSPLLTGAADYNTGMMGAGATGAAALGGDAAATAKLMNPYQQQVIDANNAAWQKTNVQGQNQVNDAATRSNAFGGSRHGVMAGVTQANNNAAQAAQTAGLLNQGFDNTMNRAGAAANMGFAAGQSNANLGFGGVGSPDAWKLRMMQQGYQGPTGQTSSGAQTTFGGSTSFKLGF